MNIKTTLKLFLSLLLLTYTINNCYATNNIYIDTISNNEINDDQFITDIKKYASDSIKFNIKEKKIYLFGNANIEYDKTKISAGYIEIDWINNTIYAKNYIDSIGNKIGYPIFTEAGESFRAHSIKYNFTTKKGYITKISTQEGEGYILGKQVKKTRNNIYYLHKGDYTTCDSENPHYSIRARKIKIIPGEKIITGPAYLNFFKIPTPLILPFGYFPAKNKQTSGILMPSYGESESLGFFLKDGGYYLAINDKIDLALRGDIYTKGSWGLKSNMRYKKRYKYNGELNLNYGNMINSIRGFPNYSIKRDFFIRLKHQQDPKSNPNLQFSANINAGTSSFHKNNSFNTDDYLNNTFQSSISISKKWSDKPFNLSANFNHNQNTQTKIINLTLPSIIFNINRIFPLENIGNSTKKTWYNKIGLSYNMNIKNNVSIADSLLFTNKSINNFKNGIKHNIPISTSIKLFKHFTLSPRINFNERWYFSQINKTWNDSILITDTLQKFTRAHDYSISAGINTKIYGLVQFKKGKISALRHVITPNISFNYQPDFSKEIYGYYKSVQNNINGDTEEYSIMQNGIFGSPSRGKTGNINLNIANIFEMKVRNKKDSTEKINKLKILENLSISSNYNIFKDSLKLNNININARTRLLNIFDINFSSQYDPYISNKSGTGNINQFEIVNNRLARLKSINTSIGMNISNQNFTSKEKDNPSYKIPWNIQANYSLTYNKGYRSSEFADTIQSMNISGNIKITPKWKLSVRSGYDFSNKDITYTSIDIYRDLHCWEMLFNWIPLGFHRSYTLTIRVKADILKDLKFEKKKDWFTPDYN